MEKAAHKGGLFYWILFLSSLIQAKPNLATQSSANGVLRFVLVAHLHDLSDVTPFTAELKSQVHKEAF